MNFEEIEQLAKSDEPLPKHPAPEEFFCYLAMETLYREYRAKRISRDTASAKKQEIRQMFVRMEEDHNRQRAAWAQYQEFMLRANGLTYEMKRALESHADATTLMRLSLDLYAALTGDSTMADNLKRRMDDDEH